jgi:DNA primase
MHSLPCCTIMCNKYTVSMQENSMMDWLLKRGITEEVLARFSIHVAQHHTLGECIGIPIIDKDGYTLFHKYRRSPFDDVGEKYMYDHGSSARLYGWHEAHKHPRILICEGELDALVAWSHNIPAVSSTGGCKMFKDEWVSWLANKEVYICYDNDSPGAEGAVKVLGLIPHAHIVLIPERPNVKDLTDYCMAGGDVAELLDTAKQYTSMEQVREERGKRIALFESSRFHDAYIKANTPVSFVPRKRGDTQGSDIEKARAYPIPELLQFDKRGKALCIWHAEKTPSLHYYPKTNTVYCFGGCGRAGDAIDVYRAIHGCGFVEAVKKLSA